MSSCTRCHKPPTFYSIAKQCWRCLDCDLNVADEPSQEIDTEAAAMERGELVDALRKAVREIRSLKADLKMARSLSEQMGERIRAQSELLTRAAHKTKEMSDAINNRDKMTA